MGERPSRQRGEGIEFVDHRAFQPGDDARRVDPFLFARFGATYVREYNVAQQVTVTVLIDASDSMGLGSPSKLAVAVSVATGLAATALAGSDTVQCGVWTRDRLAWHERVSGFGRLPDLERWWASHAPGGESAVDQIVRHAVHAMAPQGLTVLISDLWSESVHSAVAALGTANQSLIVVQVLTPEESDPSVLGSDQRTLIDSESGEEVSIEFTEEQVGRYRELLKERTAAIRQRIVSVRGQLISVSTDRSAEDFFLRDLPAAGVLR